MRRVAVTGVGLLTGLGIGASETWAGLLDGRSGVAPIGTYDASSLRTQIGVEIADLAPRDYVDRRALRTMTRYDVMVSVAAELAVRDAGIEFGEDPEGRNGLFTASNKEISDPEYFEEVAVAVRGDDGRVDMQRFGELAAGVHPLFFIQGLQGASLFYVSSAHGLRGPNTYFAGTAEAGMTAIGRGYRAIRRGEADVVIAGAGDDPVCWWNMAKIDSLGIMSAHNELGAGACRPYDVDRDGSVMGEGGAFFVLEPLEAANARGAHIYAELAGFGSSTDTYSLITPDPDGVALERAIASALAEADTSYGEISYVASHGSATRRGDIGEGQALTRLGAGAGPPASSVKPATGHLVAAAGAVNACVAALAVRDGRMPPTLNLENVDPACAEVDWIAGAAREQPVSQALAIARGFEGQNVALVFRAV